MKKDHDKLKELASKHLGKAGDGTTVKPYITPYKHDPSLLVSLPRSLNRDKSDISEYGEGFEAWHAYEMSFLGKNGKPITGILKAVFSAHTENMVESKSFKLYLNSFDLEKFSSVEEVTSIIQSDLNTACKGQVEVSFHLAHLASFSNSPLKFTTVDNLDFEVNSYTEDSSILESSVEYEGEEEGVLDFHTANLRSNCEITNQKDTGNCFIFIKGKSLPSLENLARYVFSFRNSQHFHENATEIMYNTILDKFKPSTLFVGNIYNRRGGLDIHSIRVKDPTQQITPIVKNTFGNSKILVAKTSQQ